MLCWHRLTFFNIASITTGEGSQSSGLNGFRLDLVRKLAGNIVDVLGSRREGYMANNYNE